MESTSHNMENSFHLHCSWNIHSLCFDGHVLLEVRRNIIYISRSLISLLCLESLQKLFHKNSCSYTAEMCLPDFFIQERFHEIKMFWTKLQVAVGDCRMFWEVAGWCKLLLDFCQGFDGTVLGHQLNIFLRYFLHSSHTSNWWGRENWSWAGPPWKLFSALLAKSRQTIATHRNNNSWWQLFLSIFGNMKKGSLCDCAAGPTQRFFLLFTT